MSDLESFDEDSLIENKSDPENRYKEEKRNENVNYRMNNDIINNNHDLNDDNLIYYNHVENKTVDAPIKECKSSDLNPSVSHHSENFEESLTYESVPPLNLLSEESSIIEATESCKKAFNIDLRAESMTSNSSESSSEQSRDEIIPTHWNQCSQKLKKLQLDKVNPNRSTKGTVCGSKNNYQYGEPIILGEVKDFIVWCKQSGGANICHIQLASVTSTKCLTNSQFLLSPNMKITKRHRECFQSDPILCSNRQLINNKENYVNESPWNLNNMSQLATSPILSSPTCYTQITPKINQPLFPACSAYSNNLYTLRNSKHSPVRENNTVNQPFESYWEIRPTYSSYEQLNGHSLNGNTQIESSRKEISYNSYPTSASGVFRMGILQQAELAKAHKQFCHKYYSSAPMELETKTRLHTLCSPKINTHKTTQPCFNNSNGKSLSSGNSSQRKPLILSQQRYTYKDYSLLPSINSKSRGLGPDIDNEEYRHKLARKLRQNVYAEHIRKCKEKSNAKILHSENNIINHTDSHNDTSNSSTGDKNYSNKENEEKFEPSADKCSNSSLAQATQNKSENLSDDKSKDKQNSFLRSPHQIAFSSHQTSKNSTNLESKTVSARNPPEISKEEMYKQKAAEKRLAMLNYAKHVTEVYSNHHRIHAKKQKQELRGNI
ncbi:putative cement precursor protein 3B variant 1 [Schistosoma mansoni]|uniref:putative cement precursor protein 3B variant 1 n=1 Tax=Schistosoma mansoni TaxID=6183 RepID=UPI0001A63B6E|nr:putative cement precursor protein 3B variant 1 [Schistosoma mansoni]|eukprot:XP_018648051.1 putative cement precursor protein 3B variant 1 [Schistosoma mansoni]